MELQVEEREPPQQQRCPLCRVTLGSESERWTCARCAVALHPDCAGELQRCPTLGCPERPPARAGVARDPERSPAPTPGFRPAGHVTVMTEPADAAARRGPRRLVFGAALIGALVRIALLVAGLGFLWGILPMRTGDRLPAGPSPAPPRAPAAPSEVHVLARAQLGVPPREVVLEQPWELQLRVGTTTWPIEPVNNHYRGTARYPGEAAPRLLVFQSAPGMTRYVGLTRSGRLVLARVELDGRAGTVFVDEWAPTGEPARPPALTVIEWLLLLQSPDPLEVLDALNWLGLQGRGADSRLDLEQLPHLGIVRRDAELRRQIEALANGSDPWVADAARRVLQIPLD